MMISIEHAQSILARRLIGDFINRLEIGDSSLELWFSECDLSLVAQDVIFREASGLERLLKHFEPNLLARVDPSDVSRDALLSACMRRTVEAVHVLPSAELELQFEGNIALTLPTTVPVVDWYWSLGAPRQIPYQTPYEVACFNVGELQAGNKPTHAA